MAYNYPYGNTQQLNLDWILRSWREFQSQIEDMIAPQWSDTESYSMARPDTGNPDIVIYEHELYYCIVPAATVGEFKPDEWQKFSIAQYMQGSI